MNKKIREASSNEVASAYQSNCISLIKDKRKANVKTFIDYDIGLVEKHCLYNLKQAENEELGLEFRCWKSNRDRKNRLRKRVSKIVRSEKAQFLTLTFSNDFLSRSTSETTRRRYISRFLKEQCSQYVANIDYGDTNHREHYHAIVVPKNGRIDYTPYVNAFDKSRIYAETVRVSDKSETSIMLYINKLTNHSLKKSGQYKRLIYSRGL